MRTTSERMLSSPPKLLIFTLGALIQWLGRGKNSKMKPMRTNKTLMPCAFALRNATSAIAPVHEPPVGSPSVSTSRTSCTPLRPLFANTESDSETALSMCVSGPMPESSLALLSFICDFRACSAEVLFPVSCVTTCVRDANWIALTCKPPSEIGNSFRRLSVNVMN
jgi:hypothetical protein